MLSGAELPASISYISECAVIQDLSGPRAARREPAAMVFECQDVRVPGLTLAVPSDVNSGVKPHFPHHSRRTVLQVLAAGAVALRHPLHGAEMDPLSARIQADLERHASFGTKRSASPGDLATASWVAERLRTAGYRVNMTTFDAPFLVERSTRLVSAGMEVDLYPQTPCITTGPRGITARLALIRTQADAAGASGRIALLVLAAARHAALGRGNTGIGAIVKTAAAAGAVGVVIVTTGPSGEAALLNVPEDPVLPFPVAILAPKISTPFQEAAMDGAEATLILDGQMTRRNSLNVVGRIERGNRWIAISTPRSGWFHCVGERGTGTSVFLELAEWVAGRFPDYSIHLMNTGGHEYYFTGSHRAMQLAPPPQATAVWAHIGASLAVRDADGMGRMLDTADPQRSVMATSNLNAAVAEGFRGIPELEHATPVRAEAGELSTFTDRGYTRCFAVLGVHRWFHTIEDTLARVDGRLVTPVLEAHKRTIQRAIAPA